MLEVEDLGGLQGPGQGGCSTGGRVEQGGVSLCLSQSPQSCPRSSARSSGGVPIAPGGQHIYVHSSFQLLDVPDLFEYFCETCVCRLIA